MEKIKFQKQRCYHAFSELGCPRFFHLVDRKGSKCFFVEITNLMLMEQGDTITAKIQKRADEDKQQEVEVCSSLINKQDYTLSADDWSEMPLVQFHPSNFTYIPETKPGKRHRYHLYLLKREGSTATVVYYGSSFKQSATVKILKPLNSYYEILNLIIDGEQYTFRSNYFIPRLKKHVPTKELLALSQESA